MTFRRFNRRMDEDSNAIMESSGMGPPTHRPCTPDLAVQKENVK
jgi:hypothetical protein